MKGRSLVLGMLLASVLALTACGGKEEDVVVVDTEEVIEVTEATEVVEELHYVTNEDAPEGMIVSELTGEFIDEALEKQRPIAVMIDNEKGATSNF